MVVIEFSLKITVNKIANKVVFAEASKEVVDFLLSLLAIPLGTIVKILSKEKIFGSIANLVSGVESMDASFVSTPVKATFLSPVVLAGASCANFFQLPVEEKRLFYTWIAIIRQQSAGFVKSYITYTILDDLTVSPIIDFSSFKFLFKCDVINTSDLEERVVKLGHKEGLMLLKASLHSNTVLSDVFLQTPIKSEVGDEK